MVYIISVLIKPYKNSVANVMEAIVLTDLLLLTALFLNTGNQEKAAIHPLSQLLLLLPFIVATVYITLKAINRIWLVPVSLTKTMVVDLLHITNVVPASLAMTRVVALIPLTRGMTL